MELQAGTNLSKVITNAECERGKRKTGKGRERTGMTTDESEQETEAAGPLKGRGHRAYRDSLWEGNKDCM